MDWIWYIVFSALGIGFAFILDTWLGISATFSSSATAGA